MEGFSPQEVDDRLAMAVDRLRTADALLIGAGAGMGCDSGLPDFRGNEGFWKAYPPFRGKVFAEISNPTWFRRDPEMAWGFFGHRLHLYRQAEPHVGYEILAKWQSRFPLGTFIFTSNVDGQFAKAGFDPQRITECHGSIHRLQCVRPCSNTVWPAADLEIEVDPTSIRATSPLPRCPRCDELSRPNILMFGDGDWISDPTDAQTERLNAWFQQARRAKIVAVECGAGGAIPTVRRVCEQLADHVIRINPRDYETSGKGIGLPLGAADALSRLDALWDG